MRVNKIQLAGIKRRKKANGKRHIMVGYNTGKVFTFEEYESGAYKKYGWDGPSESRSHGFGRMSFTLGQVNDNTNSGPGQNAKAESWNGKVFGQDSIIPIIGKDENHTD